MLTLPRISGKYGELKLRLGLKNGVTIVRDAYNSGPLKITKPFYLEPETGEIFLCQMCTGGGFVQGDDYYQEIELEPGTRAYFTTQSSTKIYRMNSSFARQVSIFKIGKGALFEYLPEPVIPFAGSRYTGETEIYLEDEAVGFFAEIVSPGRAGRGEVFQFDYYNSIIKAFWNGELIFWNNQMLNPASNLKNLGLYDGYTHQGSFLIFSEKVSQDLADRIHQLFVDDAGVLASASLTLKNGIAVRLISHKTERLEKAILSCWELARQEISGLKRPGIRKLGYE